MNQSALLSGAPSGFGRMIANALAARVATTRSHWSQTSQLLGQVGLADLHPRRFERYRPTTEHPMPFANIKVPQAALSKIQKEEIVHRITSMFAEYFSDAVRPYTMVLIEEVPDGGYGRADEVFVIPDAYRAKDQG